MQIEKYYDQLKSNERFRLLQAAMSRNDDTEYRRLTDTAPCKTYSMRDPEVGDRLEKAEEIALRLSLGIVDHVHWIERHSLLVHILEDPSHLEERWEKIERLEDLKRRHLINLNALYDGFRDFCLVEGFDVQEFLKAYCEPTLRYLKEAEELLAHHSRFQNLCKESGSEQAKEAVKEFERLYAEDKKEVDAFFEKAWGRFKQK